MKSVAIASVRFQQYRKAALRSLQIGRGTPRVCDAPPTRAHRITLADPICGSRIPAGTAIPGAHTLNARIRWSCHRDSSGRKSGFATSGPVEMASDEDYMAFLDKANRDPSEGVATQQQQQQQQQPAATSFKATEAGIEVPAAVEKLVGSGDVFYTSDADEPFEAVALSWDEDGKGLPDEVEFAQLIEHPAADEAEIEIMDPIDWDRQGRYKNVIDAVRQAGKGNDVRVYRVSKDRVKAEYWVVTTEGQGKGAKVVGVRALAVES